MPSSLRSRAQAGITLRVLTHPDPSYIFKIHKSIGPDYRDRILPSIGNEILKAVVAQYTAEELLTEREKISNRIEELLMERCERYNIVLDDVSITHIAYGAEFSAAIEQKQVALQRAERAKFEVAKAEQEKKVDLLSMVSSFQAEIIKAEGEAEAAEMISHALDRVGPAVIEVKRIEVCLFLVLCIFFQSVTLSMGKRRLDMQKDSQRITFHSIRTPLRIS